MENNTITNSVQSDAEFLVNSIIHMANHPSASEHMRAAARALLADREASKGVPHSIPTKATRPIQILGAIVGLAEKAQQVKSADQPWTAEQASHLLHQIAAEKAGGPIPVSKQTPPKNPLRLSLYRDKQGKWRWRMKRSGRIVATSGEGYSSMSKVKKTLTRLLATITREAYVWDEPEKKPAKKARA